MKKENSTLDTTTNCEKKPYERVWLYTLLTIPILALMGFAGYVLWINKFWLALIYIGFFILINFFQSYYCLNIDCPYIGWFCPAVVGIIPSAWLARIWQKIGIKKNKKLAEISATLGSLMLLGLIVFPLYWLFKYNLIAFFGFLIGVIVYAFAFLLSICPVCASKESCPGGKTSTKLKQGLKKKGAV
jgi:hypothetical protein